MVTYKCRSEILNWIHSKELENIHKQHSAVNNNILFLRVWGMKVGGSCSCASDSSGLLVCHTAVLVEYFLTDLRNSVLPLSRVNRFTKGHSSQTSWLSNVETLHSLETLWTFHTTVQCHVPEDRNPQGVSWLPVMPWSHDHLQEQHLAAEAIKGSAYVTKLNCTHKY